MDKATVRKLEARMIEVLKPLEAEFGVSIKQKGGTFSPTGAAVLKVQFAPVVGSQVVTPERDSFLRYAHLYGLQVEHLDQTFLFSGKSYKIVGLSTGRSKSPVLCERDGKIWRFNTDIVKAMLGVTEPRKI